MRIYKTSFNIVHRDFFLLMSKEKVTGRGGDSRGRKKWQHELKQRVNRNEPHTHFLFFKKFSDTMYPCDIYIQSVVLMCIFPV